MTLPPPPETFFFVYGVLFAIAMIGIPIWAYVQWMYSPMEFSHFIRLRKFLKVLYIPVIAVAIFGIINQSLYAMLISFPLLGLIAYTRTFKRVH